MRRKRVKGKSRKPVSYVQIRGRNPARAELVHPDHTGDIIINIETDKANEGNIKAQIENMAGVKEVIHVNIGKANINAFTKWSKSEALNRLSEIRRLKGVEDARAKILLAS